MDLANTMQEKGVSQKCQDEAVADLASCAMDDSMAVKQGCCSIDCSTGIKKVGWLACWQPIAYTAPSQTAPCLKLVTAGMPQHTHHTSLAFPAFTSLYRESPSCTTCLATVEDTLTLPLPLLPLHVMPLPAVHCLWLLRRVRRCHLQRPRQPKHDDRPVSTSPAPVLSSVPVLDLCIADHMTDLVRPASKSARKLAWHPSTVAAACAQPCCTQAIYSACAH